MAGHESKGSAQLLADRRFWPLFWTQFSVAFNDNVFKNGMLLMVTYAAQLFGRDIIILGLGADALAPISNLLLIAPFVLFSAIAGQVSDRFPKPTVIRWVKIVEIGVMILAAAAFVIAAVGYPVVGVSALLGLVFFMGLQSAFFGPSKYAILPDLLEDQGELVAGNALIELGTYVSVLGGMAVATGLIELPGGLWWLGGSVVAIAIAGYLVSRWIPDLPAENAELEVSFNPVSSTWDAARVLFKDKDVLQSVLGISWFWALGGAILVLLYAYVEQVLHAGPATNAVLMGIFAGGIGVGSIACEKLSFGRLEIGLVPFGAVGLFVGLLGVGAIGEPWGPSPDGLWTLVEIFQKPLFYVLAVDLFLLSAAGGFFMVPLYTLVQDRAEPSERSRIIGANNIVNSFFILLLQGGVLAMAIYEVPVPMVFFILGVLNVGVAAYIFFTVPEFTFRFIAYILSHVVYRTRVIGRENIPDTGAALIIANHVSFIDFMISMGAIHRPARFVMDRDISRIPVISTMARLVRVIPITAYKKDPELVERAMNLVSDALREGWIVVIFPEGGLTWDGEMMEFKRGVERILERDPVPVVPMALNGLWGSFFSRKDGPAMRRPFRRGLRNRVWVTVEPAISPEGQTAESLHAVVHEIWKRRPDAP